MAESIQAPRLTEPEIVPCIHIEGASIEVRDEFVRIVGWLILETVEGEDPERRIVIRAAMPMTVAKALIQDLRKAAARGGH